MRCFEIQVLFCVVSMGSVLLERTLFLCFYFFPFFPGRKPCRWVPPNHTRPTMGMTGDIWALSSQLPSEAAAARSGTNVMSFASNAAACNVALQSSQNSSAPPQIVVRSAAEGAPTCT